MYVQADKYTSVYSTCANPYIHVMTSSLPFQWKEFVLFAALLLAVCIIFSIMAYFYEYVDPDKILKMYDGSDNEDEDDYDTELTKNGMNMEKKRTSTRM